MTDEHVNLNNARPGVYAEVIKKIGENKICPFCSEHLHSIHPNPIQEKNYWLVTDNAYPYKPKKEHILLIHKTHISDMFEISKDAWTELHDIMDELEKTKNIEGGAFLMRFGNTKYTGASVTHLHAHIFQSNPDDPEYDKSKGVITRIG